MGHLASKGCRENNEPVNHSNKFLNLFVWLKYEFAIIRQEHKMRKEHKNYVK